MKSATNLARAVILSFEFLIVGTALLLTRRPSNWLEPVALQVVANADIARYLFLLPVGMCIWVFIQSRRLLFPEQDRQKIFQSWPDYGLFRQIVFVGLGYSTLFALFGIVAWVLSSNDSHQLAFIWGVSGIVGGGVSAFSMWVADIRVNEIFVQCSDPMVPKERKRAG